MKNQSLKTMATEQDRGKPASADPQRASGFPPQSVRSIGSDTTASDLRMYTEEEVSAMLRISLSQLRKWRMKDHPRKSEGPPFKKVGRSVRYPERGLIEFVNGH